MRPILGINFLQKYGMTIDFARRQLPHSGTATAFSSVPGVPISGVNVVSEFMSIAEQLLKQFPEITNVARATRSLQHGVECHIRTSGPPIKTLPSRLTSGKMEDSETILPADVSGRNLLAVRFSLELGAAYGPEEEQNVASLW